MPLTPLSCWSTSRLIHIYLQNQIHNLRDLKLMCKQKVVNSKPLTIRGTIYLLCLISTNLILLLLLDDATDLCVKRVEHYATHISYCYTMPQNKRNPTDRYSKSIHWQLDWCDRQHGTNNWTYVYLESTKLKYVVSVSSIFISFSVWNPSITCSEH
jgi:hypothetical protein